MREIINGIVCDTENAELISFASAGKQHDDKYWYQQTYHTYDNHYFQYTKSNYDPKYKNGKFKVLSEKEVLDLQRIKKVGNAFKIQ